VPLYRLVGGAGHGTTQHWAISRGRFLYPARGEEVYTVGSAVPQWLTENVPYEPLVARDLRLLVVDDERGLFEELCRLAEERGDANREAAMLGSGAECRRLIRIAREATDFFDYIVETGRRPGEERDTLRLITYGEPGVGRSYLAADTADQTWRMPVHADDSLPANTIVMAMDGTAVAAYEMTSDGWLILADGRHGTPDLRGRVVRSSD
jgi:hypothetical protein